MLLALGGWIVPWQHDAGVASVAQSRGAVGDVFLFAARLDADALPVLDARARSWRETVDAARSGGARVWLTIVNDRVTGSAPPVLKDAEAVHRVLSDPGLGQRHRAALVALAKQLEADGIDVDFENLASAERDAFTRFARALAADARAAGLALSITVQPKTGPSSSRGPGAMDWAALCGTADRVQVMLYNEHNASTEPGAIAGLAWIDRVIDYGLSVCPASKLVPVIKVSGMDWGPRDAVWRTHTDVAAIVARERPRAHRERFNRVPWFVYRGADGRHVVYFEDATSLAAKADRLRRRGLTSLVLWSLGSQDPEAIAKISAAMSKAQKR